MFFLTPMGGHHVGVNLNTRGVQFNTRIFSAHTHKQNRNIQNILLNSWLNGNNAVDLCFTDY